MATVRRSASCRVDPTTRRVPQRLCQERKQAVTRELATLRHRTAVPGQRLTCSTTGIKPVGRGFVRRGRRLCIFSVVGLKIPIRAA